MRRTTETTVSKATLCWSLGPVHLAYRQSDLPVRWKIFTIIEEIRSVSRRLEVCRFQKLPIRANHVVHEVAKEEAESCFQRALASNDPIPFVPRISQDKDSSLQS